MTTTNIYCVFSVDCKEQYSALPHNNEDLIVPRNEKQTHNLRSVNPLKRRTSTKKQNIIPMASLNKQKTVTFDYILYVTSPVDQ